MSMNPLDMPGPEFICFYFVVSVVTLLFIRYRLKQHESEWPMPKLNLTDPYEIALLRGGENEALRIAAVSLIDRGLLEFSDDSLKTKNADAIENVRRPIEKAILTKFSSSGKAQDMYWDSNLKSACDEYRCSLELNRLIASENVYASRKPMLYLGLLIVCGLACSKIFVAIQRDRHNIMLLVVLLIESLIFLFIIYNKKRTGLGDRVLTDLRELFKGLKDRGPSIKAGGETNEAALLAAVFGVAALSKVSFPYVKKLFPRAKSTNSCSTYSCGSSCGSSCGGGGCGGGCGGCGGD